MTRALPRVLPRVRRHRNAALLPLVLVWTFAGALIVFVAGCDSRANNDSANHPMPPPEVARTVVQPADVELPLEYVAQVGGSRAVQVRARLDLHEEPIGTGLGEGVEVALRFDDHEMHVERQRGGVAGRVAVGRHPLVDLHDLYCVPRHVFLSQRT